jgi:hypothetical protein
MFFTRRVDGANHLGIAGELFAAVIPGDAKAANPESISPLARVDRWIPGLRLMAHPGMREEMAA